MTSQYNRSFCSHFVALMRKNLISWRRTILGSLVELLTPIVLMCVIVYLRRLIAPFEADDSYFGPRDKYVAYPTASLSLQTNQWVDTD